MTTMTTQTTMRRSPRLGGRVLLGNAQNAQATQSLPLTLHGVGSAGFWYRQGSRQVSKRSRQGSSGNYSPCLRMVRHRHCLPPRTLRYHHAPSVPSQLATRRCHVSPRTLRHRHYLPPSTMRHHHAASAPRCVSGTMPDSHALIQVEENYGFPSSSVHRRRRTAPTSSSVHRRRRTAPTSSYVHRRRRTSTSAPTTRSPTKAPTTKAPTAVAVNKGGSGCTSSSKCATGEGDCDSDRECNSGLQCFQRDGDEEVPGVASMAGMPSGYNFCYDPGSMATNADADLECASGDEKRSYGSECGLCFTPEEQQLLTASQRDFMVHVHVDTIPMPQFMFLSMHS